MAVDPVKILQQQDGRSRRDHPVDRVTHGVGNRPPSQQGFEVVPARIVDGLVENGAKRGGPKIGMRGRRALQRPRRIRRGNVARLQRALQQLLQQRIGNGLLQRIAFRFQNLPVLLPQRADEFVGHPGFSDARRAHQRDDLSGRTDIPRRPLQQGNLFRAADKRRKPLGRAGPPARKSADLDEFVAGNGRGKSLQPLRRQSVEGHQPRGQALAGLRHQDLSGLRGTLEPLDQMDRRAARFIDRGEVGLDDMGDDITGMNADPDLKRRIVQQLDPANQFDRRVTGHDGVIVIRVRRTKKRDQPVAALLADDSAVAANRGPHGNQGRLKPRNCRLGIEFRDQVGRALQIGTEDGEVLPLAGDTAANFRDLRLGRMLRDDRPARRAIQIACLQGR